MILSSGVFDFDPAEDTSETTGFLDIPADRESIEESSTEGIATSSGIDWRVDKNRWYVCFAFFCDDPGSFFPEGYDSDFAIWHRNLGKGFSDDTLK